VVFPGRAESLGNAIRCGCTLYTDTTMALSGINKTLLAKFGGEVKCYISDPRVVRKAKAGGSPAQWRRWISLSEAGEKVFVFGNAPTALFRLLEQNIRSGRGWRAGRLCRRGGVERGAGRKRVAGDRRARA
jgi:precorrin-8X/cobalt-precorrin-8 methylmutase